MFTSRFTAFVFLLISFGLFVWAAPTNTGKAVAEIAARDDATSPIIAALLDLHVKVLAVVKLLGGPDGENALLTIVAAVKACIAIIVALPKEKAAELSTADVNVVADIVVKIFVAICVPLGKAGAPVLDVFAAVGLDVEVKVLLKTLSGLIPGLLSIVDGLLSSLGLGGVATLLDGILDGLGLGW